MVVAFGRGAASPDPGAHTARRRRLGLVYGAATGATIAAYTLWDAHSVTALEVPALPYFTLGLVAQTIGVTPTVLTARGRAALPEVLRRHRVEIAVVAALSPLAYVFVLQALKTAPVALVAPTRESSIVIGALLSWLVLKEPHPAVRLAGSLVLLAGVAVLAVA
jgi:drug/metabolite transporter (DMT)-like permease